jgi:hypothetical protein
MIDYLEKKFNNNFRNEEDNSIRWWKIVWVIAIAILIKFIYDAFLSGLFKGRD